MRSYAAVFGNAKATRATPGECDEVYRLDGRSHPAGLCRLSLYGGRLSTVSRGVPMFDEMHCREILHVGRRLCDHARYAFLELKVLNNKLKYFFY